MNPPTNPSMTTTTSTVRSEGSLMESSPSDPFSSIPNPSSLSQNDHRRNILHHLVLLLHAHKCLQRERQQQQQNGDGPTTTPVNLCQLPHCAPMRTVLQHMTKCSDLKSCSFHNCVQSRHIILHWKNCVTPNCFLCGSIRKPSALRPQNSLMKEWQQQIQTDHRNHLVKKIVAALLNTVQQDGRTLPADRLQAITSYAQQTEAETFNSANSQEEYFHRLAERIYKIQKDYEEKQMSKKQMLTPNLSSIDKSAGEQGPPNRIAPQSELPTIPIKSEPSTTPAAAAPAPPTEAEPEAAISVKKEEEEEEKVEVEDDRPPSIDASSKSLPKSPAVFSPEDLRAKMAPILHRLWDYEEGIWFRQPVTEAIAPGYFDIIKNPMDFSTIFKKLDENQYATPFQFCEDIWLVFNNAWTFNKKTQRVYKAGLKLADVFMEAVDPIMKEYGYCCGRQYVFLPPGMYCYGVSGMCCTIPRDGDYYYYVNPDSSRVNLSGDKYTFCKKCFDSVKSEYILVGDDPSQTLVELPKCEFQQAKNDHQEPEAMVDCIVCSRRFHNICVLHHDSIWPEGYVCKLCVQQYNIKRKENRFLAHKLAMTDLANALETRVNHFLRRDCDPETGRVTIRVLAASDRICEVKPRLKKHFGNQVPDGYPYRTKAVFAFQEIDGVDVVLFGMHVQEYDSRCPGPNARRVYISYLDSVHYFRPKHKRTALYYEILIGYLEYVKQLGFIYAHIWACPPGEGDDYIFHCHPPEQRVPKPKRLQEWYKTMLDEAVNQRVVIDFKDVMKDCTECGINKVTDIPYFEGDFWSSTIEELIKELDMEEEDRRRYEELEACKASDDGCFDDPIESEEIAEVSDKRKSAGGTTHKKKNFKKTAAQRRVARKNLSNGTDLMSKLYTLMEKHKESFFVVRLRNPMSNPATLTDTDPLIQCDLMDSRDAFLNFARDKHCEFSSLRRAKYSTMIFLIELHSSTSDKISYTCNACRQICDVRYHCTVCDDYDLCSKCYATVKHEHRMERTDDPSESTTSADTPINQQQQRQANLQRTVDAIRHAVQCRNANCFIKTCAPCQRLLQHIRDCQKGTKNQCPVCNKLVTPMWFHAKTCTDQTCPLPFCASFKHKLQRQRAATMQLDRRRFAAMHRAKMGPGPSPLNTQNPEPPTPTPAQYHPSMESASPSSSGKMMPSAGSKGGKQAPISALARPSHPPAVTSSPHPAYYNGGKGHPSAPPTSGYPSNPMMTAQTQPSPWAQQQQQQQQQQPTPMPHPSTQSMGPRYGSPMPPTGKPMAYGQQRMPYNVDPYMMRQPTPQPSPSPSSPYPYPTSNLGNYSHPHAMDPNALAAARAGKPMLPHGQMATNRHPMNPYYPHPSYMSSYRPMTPSPSPYSMPSNGSPINGATLPGGKANLVNPMEMKHDEGMTDDPSKQQQQQQAAMYHSMMQSRPRVPYYPNMQGQVPMPGTHPNASYYPNPVQRPNRPKL